MSDPNETQTLLEKLQRLHISKTQIHQEEARIHQRLEELHRETSSRPTSPAASVQVRETFQEVDINSLAIGDRVQVKNNSRIASSFRNIKGKIGTVTRIEPNKVYFTIQDRETWRAPHNLRLVVTITSAQ